MRHAGMPDSFHLSYWFLNWFCFSADCRCWQFVPFIDGSVREEVFPLYAASRPLTGHSPLMSSDALSWSGLQYGGAGQKGSDPVDFVDVIIYLVELDHITFFPAFSQSGQS